MQEINRREFLKKGGMAMGLAISSGFLFNPLGTLANTNTPSPEYFGFSKEDLQKILMLALSKGGDFSDLYFEHTIRNSVVMAEDIIKSSSENISLGVGIRVVKGEQTGYAYTNDLTFEKIQHAALTAAAIASSNSKTKSINLKIQKPAIQSYSLDKIIAHEKLDTKIKLVKQGYEAAQKYNSKISKVTASLADEIQYITIANSEGLLISDVRPQARLSVSSVADNNGNRTNGSWSAGGRIGLDYYLKEASPVDIGKRASEEAIILLDAKVAPPGEMPVVLSKDQSGVMIHESVGHPLEADFNWKKTSNMWDKVGTMVANPNVTIYDDATINKLRGSLNIDDEGTKTKNVVLIENGKLVGFLNDRLAAKIMKTEPNGHGRRESYQAMPIPRMNNTILKNGNSDPQEIIESVKKGFYAVSYQGGQVDSTGKFTFSINLGYKIENGKLTTPLKNATLIGSNLIILKEISMIGNDIGFFLGSCGKEGQTVPVTCGTPTMKINNMTVGGIA